MLKVSVTSAAVPKSNLPLCKSNSSVTVLLPGNCTLTSLVKPAVAPVFATVNLFTSISDGHTVLCITALAITPETILTAPPKRGLTSNLDAVTPT